MKAPLVTSVTERHELGGHFASVTFKVPIADLQRLLAYCDVEQVAGAGLEEALAASARADEARVPELEQPAQHVSTEAPPASTSSEPAPASSSTEHVSTEAPPASTSSEPAAAPAKAE